MRLGKSGGESGGGKEEEGSGELTQSSLRMQSSESRKES